MCGNVFESCHLVWTLFELVGRIFDKASWCTIFFLNFKCQILLWWRNKKDVENSSTLISVIWFKMGQCLRWSVLPFPYRLPFIGFMVIFFIQWDLKRVDVTRGLEKGTVGFKMGPDSRHGKIMGKTQCCISWEKVRFLMQETPSTA